VAYYISTFYFNVTHESFKLIEPFVAKYPSRPSRMISLCSGFILCDTYLLFNESVEGSSHSRLIVTVNWWSV